MLASCTDAIADLGMTRLFGACDLGSFGLVSGWSSPEEAHIWNDGPQAILHMVTQRPRAGLMLSFEGEPYVIRDVRSQEITLYVNGFRAGFWRLSDNGTYHLRATLEPEQLFVRHDMVLLKCAWSIPHSTRPVDVGQGSDTRALGFCFRSITLSEWS